MFGAQRTVGCALQDARVALRNAGQWSDSRSWPPLVPTVEILHYALKRSAGCPILGLGGLLCLQPFIALAERRRG